MAKDQALLETIDTFITSFRSIYQIPWFHPSNHIFKPSQLITYLGRKVQELGSHVPYLEKYGRYTGVRKPGILRSLVSFPDGLGKNRYIAIPDWLTQSTLKPFHKVLMAMLRSTASDYTFDQTKCIKVYHQWYKEGVTDIFCYDLSAATDRLPVILQAGIFKLIGAREMLIVT